MNISALRVQECILLVFSRNSSLQCLVRCLVFVSPKTLQVVDSEERVCCSQHLPDIIQGQNTDVIARGQLHVVVPHWQDRHWGQAQTVGGMITSLLDHRTPIYSRRLLLCGRTRIVHFIEQDQLRYSCCNDTIKMGLFI